jgi:hypothetical protein
MVTRRVLCLAAAALGPATGACAQAYPSKPVRAEHPRQTLASSTPPG